MKIIISNSSSTPIYEQIAVQIKSLIMQDILLEGASLPSMRTLASELRVSVITTKRAYEELENDGFIESFTGRGSFVCHKNLDLLREENLRQIEADISHAIEKAKQTGLSHEELIEITNVLWTGDQYGNY